MYQILLTIIVIFFPLIASFQDIFSLKVSRFIWYISVSLIYILYLIFNPGVIPYHLLVSVGSLVFYYLVRIVSRKGLGIADVFMAFFMGSVLNVEAMIFAVILQIIISLLFYAVVIIFRRKKSFKIPFIPVMTMSLYVIWFLV